MKAFVYFVVFAALGYTAAWLFTNFAIIDALLYSMTAIAVSIVGLVIGIWYNVKFSPKDNRQTMTEMYGKPIYEDKGYAYYHYLKAISKKKKILYVMFDENDEVRGFPFFVDLETMINDVHPNIKMMY